MSAVFGVTVMLGSSGGTLCVWHRYIFQDAAA